MSERQKKIVFAVFFILVSIGMGYAIYWMLFHTTPTTPPPEEQPGVTGQLPGAGPNAGQPTSTQAGTGVLPTSPEIPQPTVPTLTNTQILRAGVTQSVSKATDGNGARFYNPDDGRFYHVTSDGTIASIGDKQFFNVDSVSWANTSDEVILAFPDGSNLFYDFANKKQVNLPKYWNDFEFAPGDDHIAAKSIGLDPDNRFLFVSNPDGTEAKAIQSLGDNADKVHVNWSPTGQMVAYSMTGDAQSGTDQQILFLGQNQENFKSIVAPGQGFLPNWSPTGKQILYSVWSPDSDNKPTLWISAGDPNALGANRKALNLNTWADKCAWASEGVLYCGVPQSLPPSAGVLRSQFATLPDDVYRVDLALGSAVKITSPEQNYSIRQPVVNKDKTKFIFTDAVTGNLISYDLK